MDLPPEGLHLALQGVLDGTTKGIPVPYGSTNLTQERRQRDMADVRQELGEILDGLERIMDTATDADLEEAKVVIDFIGPAGKQGKTLGMSWKACLPATGAPTFSR